MIPWNARALTFKAKTNPHERNGAASWLPFGGVLVWLDEAMEECIEGLAANDNGKRFGRDHLR